MNAHPWVGWVVLLVASFAAGGINAIAGGGTFLTFPTLVFLGVPPLAANATSTIALLPGSMGSAWAYRSEWRRVAHLGALVGVSFLGGVLGALLAMIPPERNFEVAVPFLILFAALIFTVGDALRAAFERLQNPARWLLIAIQFLIAIYGGYLGGGIGLLMLAALSLLGSTNLHQLNGLKSFLGSAINLAAAAAFVVSGLVDWNRAIAMSVAASAGGYITARLAMKIDVRIVKRAVIVLGWLMALALLWKQFSGRAQ